MSDKPFSICVLGSSHTGCVVQAWRKRAFRVDDGVSVTFFASRALSLAALELEGRSLVPRKDDVRKFIAFTSGGKERIDLDDYDAFATVALGFGVVLSEIPRDFGTAEQRRWAAVPNLVSQACFREALKASVKDSLYLRLTDKIRSVSPAPILNVVKPYPPESVLDEAPLAARAELRDRGFLARQLALFQEAAQEASAERGAEIMWPPPETMGLPGFTKSEFAQGALALKNKPRGNADEDGKHMNEEYGYRVLSAMFARLDEMTGGHVLEKTPPQTLRAARQ